MPDRDKVKVGDLVYCSFWNGMLVKFYGKVKSDEDGLLYIDVEAGAVGYLEDAYEVRRAIIYRGNLFFCSCFKVDERTERCILVSYPILEDGTVDWDHRVIPEPERLCATEVKELERIAEKLGCELY